MAKMEIPWGDRVDAVKTRFGLEEIGTNYYDPGGQINMLQAIMNQGIINSLARDKTIDALNILNVGGRIQESMISDSFNTNEEEYIACLREEFEQLQFNDLESRFKKSFEIYDCIMMALNKTLKDLRYYAAETTKGGILSDLIGERISLYDQNFIIGIHGLPRSGKSRAGGRVGCNVNTVVERILKRRVGFSERNWVYTKEEYLRLLKELQMEKKIKGSVNILEEAGDMLNSQRFWDKDVIGAVDILRQEGYKNTCLIIISQLHRDVVRKARGLMHAVMVPWKDYRKRSIELENIGNIDFEKSLSYWKIDTLDVDPMTGDVYPQGIRVALGRVKKLGVSMPPKNIDIKYAKKDAKHKDQKLDDHYQDTIKENLQKGKKDTLIWAANEILKEKEKYLRKDKRWKTSRIGNRFGVGGRLACKIRDKAIELLETEEPHDEPRTTDGNTPNN